ncbi:hypothetical protein BDV37DRAFT_280878 [Aspergillus pseudonomiae]|uniref:P-loop containing nucleoside triphosphate hydrolase protein n=1 Tax=Aspergillus pseudonomiae TaxID=1506151 RepID=A0A5N7DKH1_9EURO|nr:uncharacterized protein BDV37DRAFT_280878 [Aspergillus pseudonomiae]KAE8406609.1 hypothetical protein BDV37DRAFT_280878 [Aspergillus pseudonomiae]
MTFAMNFTSVVPGMLLHQVTPEAFIPGYALLHHLVISCFNTDMSSYVLAFAASIAFCMYALQVFWERFRSLLLRLAESVEISYRDELYDQVIRWISSHPSLTQTQRSTAATRLDVIPSWNTDEKEENLSSKDNAKLERNPREFWMEQKLRDKLGRIYFTPAAFQTSFFKYNRRLFAFSRQPQKDTFGSWATRGEKLYFYTAPWNKQALRDFLADIQKSVAEKDNDTLAIRRALKYGSDFRWTLAMSKQPRRLSTIVLEQNLKNQIINDVQDYLLPSTRKWYQSRDFPYRRGYLFHGPPGTGKSSFCLAIASLVQLDIYVIDLTVNGLDDNALAFLFQCLPKRCIVLFEDVDQAGIEKRKSEKPFGEISEETNSEEDIVVEAQDRKRPLNSITLAGLLNVIDGVSAHEGRILIMTTNHIHQLDPALKRPGRVDMEVFLGCAGWFAIAELFLLMYSEPADRNFMATQTPNGSIYPLSQPASPNWSPSDIANLSTVFADKVPSNYYTAAKIQNFLLPYRSDPWLAVADVSEWTYKHLRLGLRESLHTLETSCGRFKVDGTYYQLNISALIFLWSYHEATSYLQPRVLLLQYTVAEDMPMFWMAPTDTVSREDASLQAALERLVVTQTGLQLSKTVYDVPLRWSTDQLNFPFIIHTSSQEPGWEDEIVINREMYHGYEWVTEDKLRNREYCCSHEEKSTILKAFSIVREKDCDSF